MSDRGPHATVDAWERLTTPTVEDDRLSRLRADPATGSYARNVCAAHEPGHPNRPTAHAVTDTQARSAVSTNGSVHGLSFRTRRRTRATVGQGPRRTTPPPPTRPDRPIVGIIGTLRIVPPEPVERPRRVDDQRRPKRVVPRARRAGRHVTRAVEAFRGSSRCALTTGHVVVVRLPVRSLYAGRTPSRRQAHDCRRDVDVELETQPLGQPGKGAQRRAWSPRSSLAT